MSLGPSPRTKLPALSYTTAVTDTTSTSTSTRNGARGEAAGAGDEAGGGEADGAGDWASSVPAQAMTAIPAAAKRALVTWCATRERSGGPDGAGRRRRPRGGRGRRAGARGRCGRATPRR